VRRAVLDASVILKWFVASEEPGAEAALRLREEFEAGELVAMGPRLIDVEILNVAGRRWGWPIEALMDLAGALESMPLERGDAPLPALAAWVGAGLTAYGAAYVALAEAAGLELITADESIVRAAGGIATPL
jgi:predicted nucleic acid-binding protein